MLLHNEGRFLENKNGAQKQMAAQEEVEMQGM